MLYEEVSKILGEHVTRKTFGIVYHSLDVRGRITPRVMNQLVVLLLEKMAELEPHEDTPEPEVDRRPLMNPLSSEFKTTYDVHGNGDVEEFVIDPFGTEFFESNVYDHVKKHLIDDIANERGLNASDPDQVELIEKEICV